ncbi:hypothetical protein HK102_000790 [Quaeritorhiza haematococci]|nr:hypothetical protein HK102_000790 [Quaeritorhiza haematococci]
MTDLNSLSPAMDGLARPKTPQRLSSRESLRESLKDRPHTELTKEAATNQQRSDDDANLAASDTEDNDGDSIILTKPVIPLGDFKPLPPLRIAGNRASLMQEVVPAELKLLLGSLDELSLGGSSAVWDTPVSTPVVSVSGGGSRWQGSSPTSDEETKDSGVEVEPGSPNVVSASTTSPSSPVPMPLDELTEVMKKKGKSLKVKEEEIKDPLWEPMTEGVAPHLIPYNPYVFYCWGFDGSGCCGHKGRAITIVRPRYTEWRQKEAPSSADSFPADLEEGVSRALGEASWISILSSKENPDYKQNDPILLKKFKKASESEWHRLVITSEKPQEGVNYVGVKLRDYDARYGNVFYLKGPWSRFKYLVEVEKVVDEDLAVDLSEMLEKYL